MGMQKFVDIGLQWINYDFQLFAMSVEVNFPHSYQLVADPYHKFCRNCGVFLNTARMILEKRFACIACEIEVEAETLLAPVQKSKLEFKTKEEFAKENTKKPANEDALTDRFG